MSFCDIRLTQGGEDRLGIAASASKGRKPIQIQAEILRHWKPTEPFIGAGGLMALPDEPVTDPKQRNDHPDAGWRDADLKRAIAVAEKAGLKSYRVEIAPDGTISVVVGDQS